MSSTIDAYNEETIAEAHTLNALAQERNQATTKNPVRLQCENHFFVCLNKAISIKRRESFHEIWNG